MWRNSWFCRVCGCSSVYFTHGEENDDSQNVRIRMSTYNIRNNIRWTSHFHILKMRNNFPTQNLITKPSISIMLQRSSRRAKLCSSCSRPPFVRFVVSRYLIELYESGFEIFPDSGQKNSFEIIKCSLFGRYYNITPKRHDIIYKYLKFSQHAWFNRITYSQTLTNI